MLARVAGGQRTCFYSFPEKLHHSQPPARQMHSNSAAAQGIFKSDSLKTVQLQAITRGEATNRTVNQAL
ncbi:hypothetical protein [Cellvibrio polysaccharolyticus]|uniref:Uncharacterized protein n=1 Tax=Cellvibrio polysaccharolyticus TaxID=2082724 RepID=A0A928V2B1_9GAMM|nr:hypothetical protein [Cellvibrio polysaccharolyticus]MBE8716508.1 hypothetical protein [Cellvibrio polysaccharolyticus]